jgi:hypothetical protein
MTKVLKRLALVVAVLGLLVGGLGVGSASAVSTATINVSYIYSHVDSLGGGAEYSGSFEAKTPGQCYQMQRRTSAGNYVTSGFWQGNFEINPMTTCANWTEPLQAWHINGGSAVYGLRFTNGVNTGTHCDTKPNCQIL